MTRSPIRVLLLMTVVVSVMGHPAIAQSRWDNDVPVFLGLAEDGLLITVAPATFTGCTEGLTFVTATGMPRLDLWSVVLVLDEGAPLFNTRFVQNPRALNIFWQDDVWVRVFPVGPQDLQQFQEAPCTFYEQREFIAEGVARMNYHSADDSLEGPGVNSWGWRIRGVLEDNGHCGPSATPELFWLQKWVTSSQTDFTAARSTASKGPDLKCR